MLFNEQIFLKASLKSADVPFQSIMVDEQPPKVLSMQVLNISGFIPSDMAYLETMCPVALLPSMQAAY
jgi:hypothetical protein